MRRQVFRNVLLVIIAVLLGVIAMRPFLAPKLSAQGAQRGRVVGIGGIFFKSANRQQMQEWYATHLGLADKGQGAMLPWREKDNPERERMTVWTIFPAT